jgi:hypothetical protein
MEYQVKHSSPHRTFRAAVLNGQTPPAAVVAQLQSQGVDTAELETRLRQSLEHVH